MDEIISSIEKRKYDRANQLHVVFVSPIPYMMIQLTRKEYYIPTLEYVDQTGMFIKTFHNDNRDKKELPNGKIIYTVAKEGWQLV